MSEQARTPMHLWIVGGLATVWHAMSASSYVMTKMGNEDHMARGGEAMRAYFEGFPMWMEVSWALGVWGALLGSLLLLARSRWAVIGFALALLGLAGGTLYLFAFVSAPADMLTPAMLAMNIAICAIGIALFVYATKMRKAGVLR